MNLVAGWIWVLAGVLAGAVLGLRFHEDLWLGGYGSWRRRMLRLAHVSFFGLGFLNIAFGLTAQTLVLQADLSVPSVLLLAGAVLMPATCVTTAFVPVVRHAFIVPVGSIFLAIALFLAALVRT